MTSAAPAQETSSEGSEHPPTPPLFVSIKEMQTMLGISRSACYALLDRQLVATKFYGRRRLVVLASLLAFVERLPTDRDD